MATTTKNPIIDKAASIAGRKFRLVTPDGQLTIKRSYTGYLLGYENVFGRLVDTGVNPWEDGNFEVWKDGKWVKDSWNAYDLTQFEKLGPNGKSMETVYGRAKDVTLPPWEDGNFEIYQKGKPSENGKWVPANFNTDFPDTTWQKSRSSALQKVKRFDISFEEKYEFTDYKGIEHLGFDYRLEVTRGVYAAIDEKVKSKREDGNDPRHYWITLSYNEKAGPQDRYSIDAKKMTPEDATKFATRAEAPNEHETKKASTPEADAALAKHKITGGAEEEPFDMSQVPF